MPYEMALWTKRLAVKSDESDLWDSRREQTPRADLHMDTVGCAGTQTLSLLLLVQVQRHALSLPLTLGLGR